MVVLIALALMLGFSAAARADEPVATPQIVIVPPNCVQFWSVPAADAPVPWDSVLSFAACIQDGRTYRVDRADDLAPFVEQLQDELAPSLHFYEVAIEEGPGPIQLRAAYFIGLGQVALMTRARASLAVPRLRPHLESLLEPHAKLAYLAFTTIDRAAARDPSMAPDAVTRYMLRSARELASMLRKSWKMPVDDDKPLLALPLCHGTCADSAAAR